MSPRFRVVAVRLGSSHGAHVRTPEVVGWQFVVLHFCMLTLLYLFLISLMGISTVLRLPQKRSKWLVRQGIGDVRCLGNQRIGTC